MHYPEMEINKLITVKKTTPRKKHKMRNKTTAYNFWGE
jgi:hypothetical protein